MEMFQLNEEKLRAAFAGREDTDDAASLAWIAPFDPFSIDADELHRIVDDCLLRDIIERTDPQAMIAVYPLAISDPEPLLSVNPGGGPMLLGGAAIHHVDVGDEEESTPEDRSIIALRVLVADANAIYAEHEANTGSKEGDCRVGPSHTDKSDDQGDRETKFRELISFAATTGAVIFLPRCCCSEPTGGSASSTGSGELIADRFASSPNGDRTRR